MKFVWSMPVKIEFKHKEYIKGKHYVYFTYEDHILPEKTPIKNLDLDKL